MSPAELASLADELETFLEDVTQGMGRLERRTALASYIRGLLLDGERKSMEPMAARLVDDVALAEGMRQRLQQAVNVAVWDEGEVFRRLLLRSQHELPDVEAVVIDDTGFPKKGRHSVGVARQYTGTLGRIDNCQVVTSLHLASELGGICLGMQLYLPRTWTDRRDRLTQAGVPEDVEFKEKGVIALELLDRALVDGLEKRCVVADAGYGDSSRFREGLVARGLEYIVGVTGTATVWPPGVSPLPPAAKAPGTRGRPRTKWTTPSGAKPLSMAELAASLPDDQWRKVTWKEGTRGPQSGYFARIRVQTARRHGSGHAPGEEQWLLCEKTGRRKKPTTYYLSNLPTTTTMKRMVFLAKLRWRIERDYQEMKGELGLDHYEGRGWKGLHHHVALVAAAHAFLTLRRALSPPIDHVSRVSTRPTSGAAEDAGALPALQPSRERAGATRAVAHVIG